MWILKPIFETVAKLLGFLIGFIRLHKVLNKRMSEKYSLVVGEGRPIGFPSMDLAMDSFWALIKMSVVWDLDKEFGGESITILANEEVLYDNESAGVIDHLFLVEDKDKENSSKLDNYSVGNLFTIRQLLETTNQS
jgi:hypothetical protein